MPTFLKGAAVAAGGNVDICDVANVHMGWKEVESKFSRTNSIFESLYSVLNVVIISTKIIKKNENIP